jgi:hypothetical protein
MESERKVQVEELKKLDELTQPDDRQLYFGAEDATTSTIRSLSVSDLYSRAASLKSARRSSRKRPQPFRLSEESGPHGASHAHIAMEFINQLFSRPWSTDGH